MPFNPVTGQWESEVLPNPPVPPPMPQQTPYNPDPQDAIERVRLAQDLRAQGLDTPSIQPNIRPDKGINIGRRNLVKGSTMEAIRPYLALLYKQVADTPLGDQPHQRALGIAARIGVGGYLGAQQAREASNAEAVKSAEELQAERRKYIGSRASELAKHRWQLQRDAAKPQPAGRQAGPGAYVQPTPEQWRVLEARGYQRPADGWVPRSWMDAPPKDPKDGPMQRRGSYNTMMDNVRVDPDVKDFITVRDTYNNAKKASMAGTSAGDIILMRYLAKISDPTTGVREEEFKTFQGAQGRLATLGVQLTTDMWGKGKLTPYGRQQLVQQLENIYETKKQAHLQAVEFYRQQAIDMGLNPDRVVRSYITNDSPVDEFAAARKRMGK